MIDEKEKYDPSGFRDAILQGLNEAENDLEQVQTVHINCVLLIYILNTLTASKVFSVEPAYYLNLINVTTNTRSWPLRVTKARCVITSLVAANVLSGSRC